MDELKDQIKEAKKKVNTGYFGINIIFNEILNILTHLTNKLDHYENSDVGLGEEFKLCPFCGSKPVWAAVNTYKGNKYECGKCRASPGYRPTAEHAKIAWNNRG